jgi:hypothetical protein
MSERKGKKNPYGRLREIGYSAAYYKWREAAKRNDDRGMREADEEHRRFIRAQGHWRVQRDAA